MRGSVERRRERPRFHVERIECRQHFASDRSIVVGPIVEVNVAKEIPCECPVEDLSRAKPTRVPASQLISDLLAGDKHGIESTKRVPRRVQRELVMVWVSWRRGRFAVQFVPKSGNSVPTRIATDRPCGTGCLGDSGRVILGALAAIWRAKCGAASRFRVQRATHFRVSI